MRKLVDRYYYDNYICFIFEDGKQTNIKLSKHILNCMSDACGYSGKHDVRFHSLWRIPWHQFFDCDDCGEEFCVSIRNCPELLCNDCFMKRKNK